MAVSDQGSLTKEPPLAKQDATIRAITPGMPYSSLLAYARANDPITHGDAPGLIVKRYLLLDSNNVITYDHFLSLTKVHPLESLFIRKIMYFLWAYRDERIRGFICDRIADGSGHWQVSKLLDKTNAKFFEKWMKPSTAKKARSNFEFFLVETGIYDDKNRKFNLELDDGWLEQATIAAAQHEKDPLARKELLADPISFLKDRKWLGLLNIASGKLPKISPIVTVDSIPLEDDAIDTQLSPASDWNRTAPASSGKTSATANIDLVERERANKSHHMLEEILVSLAKAQGFAPKTNQNIDVFFETPSGTILAEIKSCTDTNFHSQVRKAVSQLFEYRFTNKSLFSSDIIMLLIVETAPPEEKKWIIDYLLSLGILIAWKNSSSRTILTTCSIPPALANIVTSA
jgi:hypothetical protein